MPPDYGSQLFLWNVHGLCDFKHNRRMWAATQWEILGIYTNFNINTLAPLFL